MDYNATTPLEAEVVQMVSEALREAWGNPSSSYPAGKQSSDQSPGLSHPSTLSFLWSLYAGLKAKAMIKQARESVARLVGGQAQDIIFTSGGTEVCFHDADVCSAAGIHCFMSDSSFRPTTWCFTLLWSTSGGAGRLRSRLTLATCSHTSSPPMWSTTRSS